MNKNSITWLNDFKYDLIVHSITDLQTYKFMVNKFARFEESQHAEEIGYALDKFTQPACEKTDSAKTFQ